MEVPAEYHGREQSFLKHRVLQEYLGYWGRKLGSIARTVPRLELWYADCFAGPWQSSDENLADTSIHIGLEAMEQAAATWREDGLEVNLGAVFVEQKKRPFRRLEAYLAEREGTVKTYAFQGDFGAHVGEVQALLRDHPAFVYLPQQSEAAVRHPILC